MRSLSTIIIGLAVAATMAGEAMSANARLSSGEIKREIIGKRIYLATPFGGEFPLNYRKSGQVDGTGEALGLGKFAKPADTGKWWISGDRLCQKFTTWYDGAPMCFELYRLGPEKVKWIRDNGQTGTARID